MNYSFLVEHAQQYGLDEAVMIHNFQFWITQNLANDRHQHDGRTWTYNTQKAFTKLFPFWSRQQIRTNLKSLLKQEVLIKGNYNKAAFDKTTWYAFKDEKEWLNIIKKTATDHVNQPLAKINQSKGCNQPVQGLTPTNLYQIENTHKKPDKNNNNPVVENEGLKKLFLPEEQAAAKKLLSKIPGEKQAEVLAVLTVMIKTSNINNKVGYLSSMVKRVTEGTFTPLSEKSKPMTTRERIEKEKRAFKKQNSAKRVDNLTHFRQQYQRYGKQALDAMPEEFRAQILNQA